MNVAIIASSGFCFAISETFSSRKRVTVRLTARVESKLSTSHFSHVEKRGEGAFLSGCARIANHERKG